MKKNLLIGMLAFLFVIGCVISFGGANKDNAKIVHAAPRTSSVITSAIQESSRERG